MRPIPFRCYRARRHDISLVAAISRLIVAPLDVIKIRLVQSGDTSGPLLHKSIYMNAGSSCK
jgi:hypothetical protein